MTIIMYNLIYYNFLTKWKDINESGKNKKVYWEQANQNKEIIVIGTNYAIVSFLWLNNSISTWGPRDPILFEGSYSNTKNYVLTILRMIQNIVRIITFRIYFIRVDWQTYPHLANIFCCPSFHFHTNNNFSFNWKKEYFSDMLT